METDLAGFEETDTDDGYLMLDAGYKIPDAGFMGFVYKNLDNKQHLFIFAVL